MAQRPTAPEKEWQGSKDDLLADLVRKFEASEMATGPSRKLAERDLDYYHNKQWTAEQERVLAERGQPAIIDNFIKEKVNYMLGAERRLRSDPKAYPRTPAEEDRADAATQALRYVTDDNVFNRARSDVFFDIAVPGTGGIEIVAEVDSTGATEVRYHQIAFNRLWWDPYSMDPDFHDARHLGTVIWGDRDQFMELFPSARDILDRTLGPDFTWGAGTGYGDMPRSLWVDSARTRVRIVTCHWQHDGDWWTAIFCRGGFLHGPVVSPYLDRRGQTACPLIMRSANVDREGSRYGLIRDLIPLQDEVNARRSKLMHLLNTRRTIVEQGAVESEDRLRDEVARPDGLIVVNKGFRFEVDQNGEMSSGQFELLQHTIGRLQNHGPNASMTGKDPRELSGRAISLQQAGGAVEQEAAYDGLRLWARRVYEATWMRVRQFWDAPRWLRVTDETDTSRYVGINRPITFADALGRLPPDQQAVQMQRYGVVPGDPRLSQVVAYENDIGDLDMEITVEEGQDTPTMAAEQFQALMQFATANPGAIPVEVLLEASSLKNKQKLLEGIKDHQQEQAQTQAASQQAAHAMQQATLALTQARTDLTTAQAQHKQVESAAIVHDATASLADQQHRQTMDVAAAMAPPAQVVPPPGLQPQ